ncbi:hypothetical protein M011DRAFT_528247 [Sporormia fimetaria CBS 119925]|uniref:DNA 3'-5' helicase n=1 Tax=Sporormia fimetaria CBS 119925 TaxID=1340428 RepID=A0A6A6V3R0_9PLEO|nr:hypothetical protein M011DRAFT_528247 [Sporormia fimetaria CBS 119925]
MSSRQASTWGGIPMKPLSLITLTVQNSALILVMHYSRIMPLVDGQRYFSSTSVFLNEVIKLAISMTMALYELATTLPADTPASSLSMHMFSALFANESWKLGVPAVLYTVQNSLQYVAVSNLDAATFQVTYQLKILTTAMFSVALLGRKLSAKKWVSLVLLVLGVSIVQLPSTVAPSSQSPHIHIGSHELDSRSATHQGIKDSAAQDPSMNRSVGFIAVFISCALSGLAGVWFERVLKSSSSSSSPSLWIRNCQLSFWSLFPAFFIGILWIDGSKISKYGFFAGYDWIVWTAVLLQAFGGVVVALVIKYADNIAKNFATSLSVILSCAASVWFFNFRVTKEYVLGTSVVLFATWLYSQPDKKPAAGIPKSYGRIFTPLSNMKHSVAMDYNLSHFNGTYGPQEQQMMRRQHSLTQPQFMVPAQTLPPRERYRARRQEDVYAIVDDDLYADGEPMDWFDRQIQAQMGHTRLSFPPNQPTHPVAPPYAQSQARLSFPPTQPARTAAHPIAQSQQPIQQYDYVDERVDHPEQQRCDLCLRDLAQFAYGEIHDEESSDMPIGESSSPAFKAGQRRPGKLRRVGALLTAPPVFRRPDEQFPESRDVEHVPQQHSMSSASTCHNNASPVIQGIQLVPVTDLPDRLRTVFPFPAFNAVQSKCFDQVFNSDDNFVLASPTGSGKTAVLELAICRAVARNDAGQYKIVYQAPIKALCSERQADWQKKFNPLNLKCVQLTGDSDSANLHHVQTADIIVTTPEKWDSITRKWKDHEKLLRLIKLFLIDEVHILKEERGAILEAVVSRMKTIGTEVRFVALSATVPNLDDIASWLGKSSAAPYFPANSGKFGEEFRPVKLKKFVCGYPNPRNDFALDKTLANRLPEVIAKHSERKPIMVFCMTRNSCVSTAKILADWWASSQPQQRYWREPSKTLGLQNADLRKCAASGVAFHHAGLDAGDRQRIEKAYLDGDIGVICCTSTLAVGVNLPCHFVIIKNTTVWAGGEGMKEYSDLEIMQMMGRAGRPQFDNSAVAVIMTSQAKVRRYETMVTGEEVLESTLHTGLVEHLNAEIGLGTIRDVDSARNWLSKTFLYVRLKKNPAHYNFEKSSRPIEEQVDEICMRDLEILQESELVTSGERFKCTEFGDAMAKYYVKLKTMQAIVDLPPKAQISEILSALAQAAEFSDMRFRSGEKPFYKAINSAPSIRFPIPVTLNSEAHKVSLIIQSVLGSADIQWNQEALKHRQQYTTDMGVVFRHSHRLIRCIADCQITQGDSVALMNALMVQRSLRAQAWDDSPLHMRQIPNVGVVTVRKLVNAGIRSIEELESADAGRLDTIMSRNPGFGRNLLAEVAKFPKLQVSASVQGAPSRKEGGVKVQLKVDIGVLNDQPLEKWNKLPVYICFLVETSDGRIAHFARISAAKLGKGQKPVIPVVLRSPDQCVNCYIMCDDLAGTMRQASLKPAVPPSLFPPKPHPPGPLPERPASNTSKRRVETHTPARRPSDDFDDGGLDDADLVSASVRLPDLEFDHIENYANPTAALTRANTAKNASGLAAKGVTQTKSNDHDQEPRQLDTGRWACNHKCKDKTACKHFCCREGLAQPPKKPQRQAKAEKPGAAANEPQSQSSVKKGPTQTKLHLAASKRKCSTDIATLDLTHEDKRKKPDYEKNGPRDYRILHQLHKNVQKRDPPASVSTIMHKKPGYCYSAGGEHSLAFLEEPARADTAASSDYGEFTSDDVQNNFGGVTGSTKATQDISMEDMDTNTGEAVPNDVAEGTEDLFGDDDSVLADAMIGLADSQDLENNTTKKPDSVIEECNDFGINDDFDLDDGTADPYDESPMFTDAPVGSFEELNSSAKVPSMRTTDTSSPFFGGPKTGSQHFRTAKSMLDSTALKELKNAKNTPKKGTTSGDASDGKGTGGKENRLSVANDDGMEGVEGVEGDSGMDLDMEMMDLVAKEPATCTEVEGKKEEKQDQRYEGLEPWFLAEFGDVAELVDG